MNTEVIENEETNQHYTDKEMFLKVWTKPGKIFEYFEMTGYDNHFYIVLFLAGVSSALSPACMI